MRRCRFLDSEFQGEMLAVISKHHKSFKIPPRLTYRETARVRSDFHRASEWHSDTADYALSIVGSVLEV